MKCGKCGKELQDEWTFCNYCGNQIKFANEGNEPNIRKAGKWKKYVKEFFSSKTIIIYTIMIVLVILCFIISGSDISMVLYMGVYSYLTILLVIILPLWIINKILYDNQNEIKIEEKVTEKNENKEYRKKCNVCGYIFCYTDEDIIANNEKRKLANRYRVGMVTQGLMGNNKIDWRYNQEKMEQSLSQIIDFSKCFKCGSTDIIDYNNEKQNEENVSINNIDEIVKYKELLDNGILTKEEFDKKKKEILNL